MRKKLSESILDLRKCPNRKTHESESAYFLVGELCKVQNQIWQHFSHKVIHNYYYKFLFWVFWPIFNKVKKWISHCIFKSYAEGFRVFFQARKLFFLQNGLYSPTQQPWGSSRLIVTPYSFGVHPFKENLKPSHKTTFLFRIFLQQVLKGTVWFSEMFFCL